MIEETSINKETKIAKNISQKFNILGKTYGEMMKDRFIENISEQIIARGISSPIEQLLYFSLKYCLVFYYLEEAEPFVCYKTKKPYLRGILINTQDNIDKYYIDFTIEKHWREGIESKEKTILVECDSQEWHERTEEQRRYEKERDRIIQKLGYKIFHYTGKEILQDPLKIAKEILIELGEDCND